MPLLPDEDTGSSAAASGSTALQRFLEQEWLSAELIGQTGEESCGKA